MTDRPPKVRDLSGMIYASGRAAARVKRDLRYAAALRDDADRERRLAEHECMACYYPAAHYGRMAGQSSTATACSVCGTRMVFGDTAIDACCDNCARKYGLCKHCGGDLDMRARRRKWPEIGR